MSAYTAPGRSSLPQRSSSTSSSRADRAVRRRRSAGSAGFPAFSAADTFGIRIADEPFVAKPAGHQLLDVVFGRRHAVARAAGDRVERAILDAVQLRRTPSWCVAIAAASHDAAKRCTRSPDDTTSTPSSRTSSIVPASTRPMYGIAQRGEYSIATRLTARQQPLEAGLELVASGVLLRRAGQVRERIALDRVHEPARLARRGNQVVPAACREMAALPADTRHVGCDRVQPAEIVEQPGVDAVGAERRLHGGDVHRPPV